MDWKTPVQFTHGARGMSQESENPSGYAVTCTINANGTATYIASFREKDGDKQFANFFIQDPRDRALMKNAARSMRVACGMHHQAGVVD